MTTAKKRRRHPAYSAFWAHPRHGCHEVTPGQDHRHIVKSLPGLDGGTVKDALAEGWIVAVRWSGDEDIWRIRCQEATRSRELLQLLAKYLENRYPEETGAHVVVLPVHGDPATSRLAQLAGSSECRDTWKRPNLPGNPDTVLLEVRNGFGRKNCNQPHDRRHHPDIPGFWLHRRKGRFALRPDEHHSEFFLTHPDIFGTDLGKAFEEGWVSIRRWTGYREEWSIRYDDLGKATPLLRAWATEIVDRYPDERLTPIRCFPASDTLCLCGTLGEVANGTAQIVEVGSNFLPAPKQLAERSAALWTEGYRRFGFLPWPDYAKPFKDSFRPMSPLAMGARHHCLESMRQHLADCEARIRAGEGRGFIGGMGLRLERQNLRSWIQQLETGDLPACVGDGYREWFTHVRQRDGVIKSEDVL